MPLMMATKRRNIITPNTCAKIVDPIKPKKLLE